MYAKVVIDHPIEPLLYGITPEILLKIKLGCLVEVPFGRRKKIGIVLAFKKRVEAKLASKIKPINRVLSRNSWIDRATLKLAQSLSHYSSELLGVILFRLLPTPTLKQTTAIFPNTPPSANVKAPLRIHLYGSLDKRLEKYLTLIQRAARANKQIILVAPKCNLGKIKNLLSTSALSYRLVLGSLAKTKQQEIFNQFRTGTISILIGSRQIIGWPARDLGLIIVDDPAAYAHIDDQRPYLDSATIAYLRFRTYPLHLVFGSSLPTLGMYLSERAKGTRAIRLPSTKKPIFAKLSSYQLLTQGSLGLIRTHLKTGQKVIIIAHRQGGQRFYCLICRKISCCPACKQVLEISIGSQQPICFDNCRLAINPTVCLDCQQSQMLAYSTGQEALEKKLNDELGPLPPNIIVDREGVLDRVNHVAAVIFAFADSPLISPQLNRPLEFLTRIKSALDLTDKVVIQTFNPNHFYWQALEDPKFSQFERLLRAREDLQLPPFYREIIIWPTNQIPRSSPKFLSKINSERLKQENNGMIRVTVPAANYQRSYQNLKAALDAGWKIRPDSILNFAPN